MKFYIYLLLLGSSVSITSCSTFEKKEVPKVLNVTKIATPNFITKSIFYMNKLEKIRLSRLGDSTIFFEEWKKNSELKLELLCSSKKTEWNKEELQKMGLEFDTASIFRNDLEQKITFFKNKKNLLYEINKTYFIHVKRNKIESKSIKISQKLLNGTNKKYEINYNFLY